LSLYINKHPDVLDAVSDPGLYLSAVSEVELAVRLHEFGLLPEEQRKQFVTTVSSYALEGEDLDALRNTRIQSIFTQKELHQLRSRVRTELLPKLREVRYSWQYNHSSDLDPGEDMQPFLDSLSTLKDEFSDDEEIIAQIERERVLAEQWISEQMPDDDDRLGDAHSFGKVDATTQSSPQARGIFDDIDE
jgi:hypothetical protein